MCLTEEEDFFLMATIDGRTEAGEGLTLAGMAEAMIRLGNYIFFLKKHLFP